VVRYHQNFTIFVARSPLVSLQRERLGTAVSARYYHSCVYHTQRSYLHLAIRLSLYERRSLTGYATQRLWPMRQDRDPRFEKTPMLAV